MSMLQKVFGNAVEADVTLLSKEFKDFIIEGEEIIAGYKLIRDSIVFTTERLILVDVQGITGSKVSYKSVPYSSVKVFSMETAGTFDLDNEIKLYVHGYGSTIDLKFKKGTNLKPIYKVLSTYALRDN